MTRAVTLIDHDLLDELQLTVYPVVLGAGDRLFGELADKIPLRSESAAAPFSEPSSQDTNELTWARYAFLVRLANGWRSSDSA